MLSSFSGAVLRLISIQHFFFACAVFLYAVFSSPTPDKFGFAEIAIFICLLLSLKLDFRNYPGFLLASYGISIPLILSLIYGYPLVEIIRDIIPFFFLLMPILYGCQDKFFLGILAVGVGIAFSVRSLLSFEGSLFEPQNWLGMPPDLLYLANSPEVLFSAIMLLAMSFQSKNMGHMVFYAALAILPLLAMATLMQRASLFYLLVCGIVCWLVRFWRMPRKALLTALIVSLLGISIYSFLDDIFQQLSFKTQMVGLNSRGAEWGAVINQVLSSPFSFLFGMGWGSEIENPAVGGLRVSFTHSLLSSLLLKTGITGVMLFLIYCFSLVKGAFNNLHHERIYLYSLAGPLLIGLFLYASYKSLGYGLLLLILASLACKRLDEHRVAVP